jgi:REP element-mobilizing transposase RayT
LEATERNAACRGRFIAPTADLSARHPRPSATQAVGADLSRPPPIYRPAILARAAKCLWRNRHDKRLEDMNILWYYLPITHLLHAWVGVTSRKGGFPMSKRLAGYDYSQPGFYFVTICTQQHRLVFGTIVEGQVYLKGPGHMAQSVWVTLPRRFAHVKLHEYVFMPNHMHAIVELTDLDPAHVSPRAPLWEIVRVFKAATSYQNTSF